MTQDSSVIAQGLMQGGSEAINNPWILPIVIAGIVIMLVIGLILLFRKPHKKAAEVSGGEQFGKTANIHWRTAYQHDLDERLKANEDFHALPREMLHK